VLCTVKSIENRRKLVEMAKQIRQNTSTAVVGTRHDRITCGSQGILIAQRAGDTQDFIAQLICINIAAQASHTTARVWQSHSMERLCQPVHR